MGSRLRLQLAPQQRCGGDADARHLGDMVAFSTHERDGFGCKVGALRNRVESVAADPREAVSLIRLAMTGSVEVSHRASAVALADKSIDERLITRSKEAIANSRDHLADIPPSRLRQQEFADLKLANTHLDLARRHIHRQRDLIDRLSRNGISTELAERLLDTMQSTLLALEAHRTFIRGRLGM